MDFELHIWDDGTARLVHWDHLTGEDIVILLADNGQAYLVTDINEDDEETQRAIDFVSYLREMALNAR